jgi:hypothetical protein
MSLQHNQREQEAVGLDKEASALYLQMQKDPTKAEDIANNFKGDPRVLINAQNLRVQNEANQYLASSRGKEDKMQQLKLNAANRAKDAEVVKTAFQENATNKYDLYAQWHNKHYPDLHTNNGVNQDGTVTLTPVVPGEQPITMQKPDDKTLMSIIDRAIVGDESMIQMELQEKAYIWKANAELNRSTASVFVDKSGKPTGYHSIVQIDPNTKQTQYLIINSRTNKTVDPESAVKNGWVTQDELKIDRQNKADQLHIELAKLNITGQVQQNANAATQGKIGEAELGMMPLKKQGLQAEVDEKTWKTQQIASDAMTKLNDRAWNLTHSETGTGSNKKTIARIPDANEMKEINGLAVQAGLGRAALRTNDDKTRAEIVYYDKAGKEIKMGKTSAVASGLAGAGGNSQSAKTKSVTAKVPAADRTEITKLLKSKNKAVTEEAIQAVYDRAHGA